MWRSRADSISRISKLLFAGLFSLAMSGCATYAPIQVDPKSDLYSTATDLDKSAIREYDTSIDPQIFRFIALNANSNVYQARFEFFVRNALSYLGIKQVLNQDELAAMVKMHPRLKDVTSTTDSLAIKKISDTIGPMLFVDFNSTWDGDVRRYVSLKIVDGSTGRVLLRIEHPKLIWANVDSEAHYPVLNALRQWFKASTNKKTV